MNSYASARDIQQAIDDDDVDHLLALSEAVSRAVDRLTGRRFYALRATRHVSPRVQCNELDPGDDVVSLDTVEIATSGDGSYEVVGPGDYWLEPEDGPPFRRLVRVDGSQWPAGRRVVRLTGTWGYSNEQTAAGAVGTGGVGATGTALPLAAGHAVSAGDTLHIGAEQLYVRAVNDMATTATVLRGVNGTAAAAHPAGAAIARQVYPADLVQAVVMQISRFYHERRTGGAVAVGDAAYGITWTSLYPAIRDLLSRFRLGTYAVAVG